MADQGQELLDLLRASPASNTSVNTVPVLSPPPAPGIERYAREGVPLDTTTGADFWSRAGLSFVEGGENRADFIKRAYAGAQVDPTDDGNLIVRNVQDQRTGQAKDLLVDETGFNASKDIIADLAAPVLRTAFELAVTKRLGFSEGGLLKRVVGGSTMAAAQGEGFSATAQALLGAQQTFGEHLISAGKNAALGTAMGAGVEAVGGVINAARGRLTGEFATGATERSGISALDAMTRDTNVKIIPSLGQMAESPDVLNLETFLKRLPFFGTRLRQQAAEQVEQQRSFQRQVFGPNPPQPLAELGADLVDVADSVAQRPAQVASMAERSLAMRAGDQIESAIARIEPAARNLGEECTATLTKVAAKDQFASFKEQADQLFTEAGNPDIPLATLKPRLAEIESKLPKVAETSASAESLNDLVNSLSDETKSALGIMVGKPLVTEAGTKVNRDLVPAALTKLVRGLRNLGDSLPLEQLRTVRNSVDNAIREGRGLEGINVYQLKQVSHALTQTLEDGINAMPDQVAAKALKRANNFYKENLPRFEVPFAARLLKDGPADAGYIGNFELVRTIRNDPDRFRELEQFMKGSVTEGGKATTPHNAKAFNAVRRALLEDVLSSARVTPSSSTSRINADAFAKGLEHYPAAIQSSIMGVEEGVIRRNLDLLKQLKEGYKDVPPDKLDAFLRFPANSLEDLSKLGTASKASARVFENEVIKKLLKGEAADPAALGTEQALDWMLSAKNNSDVAELISYAADRPEVIESIRQNTAIRLYQEVAQKTKPSDAARLNDLTQLVDPARLIERMRDPASRARLRTMLGNDTFNLIENHAISMSVLGKTGQGSLSTGATATSILTRTYHFFKNVPFSAKLLIYSKALTNPSLQKAVMEGSLNPATDLSEWTLALMSSAPLVEALYSEFGKAGAELIGRAVRAGMPQEAATAPATPPPVNTTNTTDQGMELLQHLKSKSQ